MADYKMVHVDGMIIENESSGVRGLAVNVSVDTLENVIIELGSSMTIRTDRAGAKALSLLMCDADATLHEMEELAIAEAGGDGNPRFTTETTITRISPNDPVDW